MARIVLGSYMVRYPLGGMMSWVLQYIVGLQQLGHEVYFVEKAGYDNACYDPVRDVMTNDCAVGTNALNRLLDSFGLAGNWCFVDTNGEYYNMSRVEIEDIFATADLFIDMGTHGAWLPEAEKVALRILIDGEPGFTQMKMAKRLAAGETLPEYDYYYTTGLNVGTEASLAPSAGKDWRHMFHPVVPELFSNQRQPGEAYTTIMNWQSYEAVEYDGQVYGHKDVEFERFIDLPRLTNATMEVAVSGGNVPSERISAAAWRQSDAHSVTVTFDSFREYIFSSRGEFSVCKSGYVRLNTGWFSDRSAAYLASGRPVVMQETGFSTHLPCGRGLFAVSDSEQAAAAIAEIETDYAKHSGAAIEIARDLLAPRVELKRVLDELGV